MSHRGRQPATTDDLVYLPPRLNVNLGTHYGFRLARQTATLRVQVTNLFDNPSREHLGARDLRSQRLARNCSAI